MLLTIFGKGRRAPVAQVRLAILALGAFISSCSDFGGLLPPDIPAERLLSIPDTVQFHQRTFTLHADLWREFMPGPDTPPGGKPLLGMLFVTAVDSAALPPTVSVDAVWLVNVDEVWRSWLSNEGVPEDLRRANRLVRYLRGGPAWGPSIAVDVIVRLADADGTSAYLRAEGQWIWSPV